MKSIKMKGKNTEEAITAAIEALGTKREQVEIKILNAGKAAVMGIIGGEEAEVEVIVKGSNGEEAQQALQNILDKMGLLAIAEIESTNEEEVRLAVTGEDMGRIIGKEGAMLKALEIVIGAITRKIIGAQVRIRIDAGGYAEKRERILQQLAAEVAEEVASTGKEKNLPYMEAADRRIIHLFLKDKGNVTSYSTGEGRDRRMVIAPK